MTGSAEQRDVVIRAEGLGKSYVIGHDTRQGRYSTLRETLARALGGLRRSTVDMLRGRPLVAGDETEEFWALRNVDFEIRRGEVVGIIGRNGAGKSTLLKILSRITEPTEGRVTIKGRVASLLEVGTGFHPELSGRENIYLNGAILGMSRAEIRAKFDEIVAFAEIDKFLDTPVKRYSSGMYVRLAFAVAAHLEPEILIVDEVLAVGDAEFQKKCLGKMGEVGKAGRTVLFVSHNLAAIRKLCTRGLVLARGAITFDEPAHAATAHYLRSATSPPQERREQNRGCDYAITKIEVLDPATDLPTNPTTWGPTKFRIWHQAAESIPNGMVSFQITKNDGELIFFTETIPDHALPYEITMGEAAIDIVFDRLLLSHGDYFVGAGLAIAHTRYLCHEPYALKINVDPADIFGSGSVPVAARSPLALPHKWVTRAPRQVELLRTSQCIEIE